MLAVARHSMDQRKVQTALHAETMLIAQLQGLEVQERSQNAAGS